MSDTLTGVARAAGSAYTVIFETSRPEAAESMEVRVALSEGEQPVTRAVVRLSPRSGTLTIGRRVHSLPAEVAADWWHQLTGTEWLRQFAPELQADGTHRVRFPAVMPLAPGIPGRAELTFRQGGASSRSLSELRLFSLEEWNNSFQAYVSLGLSREGEVVRGSR